MRGSTGVDNNSNNNNDNNNRDDNENNNDDALQVRRDEPTGSCSLRHRLARCSPCTSFSFEPQRGDDDDDDDCDGGGNDGNEERQGKGAHTGIFTSAMWNSI